jgi:hypothetical protein
MAAVLGGNAGGSDFAFDGGTGGGRLPRSGCSTDTSEDVSPNHLLRHQEVSHGNRGDLAPVDEHGGKSTG